MHHQGEHTTLEERVQINELARIGMSDSSIARCLGCSVWTVRKWRRRVQQQGRGGLRSQLGRPARGVLSTLPQA